MVDANPYHSLGDNMNANELADELDSISYDCTIEEWRASPVGSAATMLRQQQAEIERLIGSKPITYGMLTFCKKCGEQNPYSAKTLTDEEIIEIWSGMETDTGEQNIAFARAILRKAGEK